MEPFEDLDQIHVSFDPPLWRKPKRKRRAVFLTLQNGLILTGIVVLHSPPGSRKVEVPETLEVSWPSEQRGSYFPLGELQRDLIRLLVRDALHPRRGA